MRGQVSPNSPSASASSMVPQLLARRQGMPRLPFQKIHPKPAQYDTSTVGRKDDAFNAEKLFSIVFRVCNDLQGENDA